MTEQRSWQMIRMVLGGSWMISRLVLPMRIMADSYTDTPQDFDEFWDFYVSQHLDPTTRALHFAGISGALGCLAVAPVFPLALAAAPVCGYGFAWYAHLRHEKNRPATFTYPRWSLMADFVMYKKMWMREMGAEVERVKAMMRAQGLAVPGEDAMGDTESAAQVA